jgi:ABC-type Na+ efflux pump permease subunit
MSGKRVVAITRRVVRQVVRDRRTVALLFLAPMLILTLGAILFRADPATVPLGVVNEDQGTMERLAATPATRGEIVVGYMSGLGLFGLIQVAVILF